MLIVVAFLPTRELESEDEFGVADWTRFGFECFALSRLVFHDEEIVSLATPVNDRIAQNISVGSVLLFDDAILRKISRFDDARFVEVLVEGRLYCVEIG
jgi:hypothetical protein